MCLSGAKTWRDLASCCEGTPTCGEVSGGGINVGGSTVGVISWALVFVYVVFAYWSLEGLKYSNDNASCTFIMICWLVMSGI